MQAVMVIVLEASDSRELIQQWNSRKGKHVHVGHFLSPMGFWLLLESEFLRSSPVSGLMGGVV